MKTVYLWINQYGNRIHAATKKELKERAGYSSKTKGFPIMRDTSSGTMVVGYGVGSLWFTKYAPVMVKA